MNIESTNNSEEQKNQLRLRLAEIFSQNNDSVEEGCGCGDGCGCQTSDESEMESCNCGCTDEGCDCKN